MDYDFDFSLGQPDIRPRRRCSRSVPGSLERCPYPGEFEILNPSALQDPIRAVCGACLPDVAREAGEVLGVRFVTS